MTLTSYESNMESITELKIIPGEARRFAEQSSLQKYDAEGIRIRLTHFSLNLKSLRDYSPVKFYRKNIFDSNPDSIGA